jgi:glucose/arabinose dehydrogenase
VTRLTIALAGALTTLALVVAGCGSSGTGSAGDDPAADTAPLVDPPPTTAPAPPPTGGAEPAPLADIDLDLEPVATVPAPMAMTTIPDVDDRAWVAGRDGRLHEIDLEAGGEGTPALDFSADVSTSGEQGFLGVATAPDGGHLYTSYTDLDGATRIDEYALEGDGIDESSRRQVLGLPQPFANHNGGNIAFGPDGLLYLGLGDGGSAGDPGGNGQDTTTLLGSVIRIDPTAQGDRSYGSPGDNPFTDDDGRTEIWLYGVRNPWRFSFDRATGDLWIGDVGQNEIEEIDVLPATAGGPAGKGANLGWNLVEGSRDFAGSPPPDHVPPVFEYDHGDGNCSVTGGFVYRGTAIPELTGAYLFGDYCVSEIRGLRVAAPGDLDERGFGIGVEAGTLVSFGEDAAGELYVLSAAGGIDRIVPG